MIRKQADTCQYILFNWILEALFLLNLGCSEREGKYVLYEGPNCVGGKIIPRMPFELISMKFILFNVGIQFSNKWPWMVFIGKRESLRDIEMI